MFRFPAVKYCYECPSETGLEDCPRCNDFGKEAGDNLLTYLAHQEMANSPLNRSLDMLETKLLIERQMKEIDSLSESLRNERFSCAAWKEESQRLKKNNQSLSVAVANLSHDKDLLNIQATVSRDKLRYADEDAATIQRLHCQVISLQDTISKARKELQR